jgi:hypothetical protein
MIAADLEYLRATLHNTSRHAIDARYGSFDNYAARSYTTPTPTPRRCGTVC